MGTYDELEARRLRLQTRLDAAKTGKERNKLGQFATPPVLAEDILKYARSLLPADSEVRFLDPAFGTGTFYSALLRTVPPTCIASASAYEIDEHYYVPTEQLWGDSALDLHLFDFTRATPPSHDRKKTNLIICNPPYVRHHYLSVDEKARLQARVKQITGVTINKLAGLYCYFMLLSHAWLALDGVAGWLIPSEFMDVNYGRRVKHYLLHRVTLLRVHRFEPTDIQFTDALVSSAVVWFKNCLPPTDHMVHVTAGGTLSSPRISSRIAVNVLEQTPKWGSLPATVSHQIPSEKRPTLADLFTIKRGIATGDNKFFILTQEQAERHELPREFLKPILPSPRYLQDDIVASDTDGNPAIKRLLFLLSCALSEAEVRERYPSLWRYLRHGIEAGVDTTYLCSHRRPWYAQEQRPHAPLLCTYMGRQGKHGTNPFRFILNYSTATAANAYHLLYPKPMLAALLANDPTRTMALWQALHEIAPATIMGEGRVYGGGLHKVEPRELAYIPAREIVARMAEVGLENTSSLQHDHIAPVQLALI